MGGEHVVVVGASLAGFRAAEELRFAGHTGPITMVGDEPHRPYERPPLSKAVLAGQQEPHSTMVRPATGTVDELDLEWCLGSTASGLDVDQRTLSLAGGGRVAYDGLVIATGASARRLPGTDHLAGVHTLRTLDDSLELRTALEASPQRVAVVGFGFIGAEVAATCRGLGIEVSLIEALPVPMERALGQVGAVMGDLHRDHGVDVRLGVGVVRIDGADRAERVRLTDGSVLDVDLVVVGIGVLPNTDWLTGSGLAVRDGVVCDSTCRVVPGVVAAGDVARWSNERFGQDMRVEHWDNAVEMGAHAARTLLADLRGHRGEPFSPVPWFWSDQYDRKLQLAGLAGDGDLVEVVTGSLEDRRFVAFYGRHDRLVGVLGMNHPAAVMRYRALVERGAAWDEALGAARETAPS